MTIADHGGHVAHPAVIDTSLRDHTNRDGGCMHTAHVHVHAHMCVRNESTTHASASRASRTPGQDTVAHRGHVPLFPGATRTLQHNGSNAAARCGERGGHEDARCSGSGRAVDGERRARIEAVPAHPKDERSEGLQHARVAGHRQRLLRARAKTPPAAAAPQLLVIRHWHAHEAASTRANDCRHASEADGPARNM